MSEAAQPTLRARGAAELVVEVEQAVMRGELLPGQRLPSVRSLAAQVGLSPVTVAAGLAELRRRGVVVTERRRGSRIGEAPPIGAGRTTLAAPQGVLDLSRGNPDPELLPKIARALPRAAQLTRLYGEPPVLPALAEHARELLRGEGVDAGEVCVLSGALDAIERVILAELRPGDAVAVEDPGYVDLYHLLRAAGMRLEPVAVDARGILPAALARALERGARAVVITPRAQNPTGAKLDAARAQELREVLDLHPRALLVEDDHFGPIAAAELHTLTRGRERWAFTRSVAKSLGPDLRVALLAGDEHTLARVQGRQQCGPGWVSHLLQALVLELWRDRSVQRLIVRAASTYGERRERLRAELAARGVDAQGASGMNVWIPVPEEAAVLASLLQRGYLVAAGAPYRLSARQPAVRVTTATLEPAAAGELAGHLAELLAGAATSRSG